MKKTILLLIFILLLPLCAHAETRAYRVAGVTFNNNDGSSRQTILHEAYEKGSKHSGSLKRYLYEGKGAIYVLLNGEIIGNIPEENVSELLPLIEKIDDVYITVGHFYGDEGKLIYYAQASISFPSLSSKQSSVTSVSSSYNSSSTSSSTANTGSDNSFHLLLFLLVLIPVFCILSWIYVKTSPWQHKILSGFVVICFWSFVRVIILELLNIEHLGFIPFLISYFPFVWVGKRHYNHLTDKPVRDKQAASSHRTSSKRTSLHPLSRKARKNMKHLLAICSALIDKYEGNVVSCPSCKSDLLSSIKNQLCNSSEELVTWQDHETDYIRIAHTLLFHHTFDLLASGNYHMYTNMLSPFQCGQNLLRVFERTLESAVSKNYLTTKEMDEQMALLKRRISEVG